VQTDIAVLKVEYDGKLPCVTLGDSDTLQTGELVIAIGNALGTLDDTVTVGVVSALDREIKKDGYTIDVIQTDAAINNGNSGGPLINSFGEVIGITNAKMVTSSSEGLGFAIPIDTVKEIIEDIINYGKVINRPYLGVSVMKVEEGAYYGVTPGVYAAKMVIGGPADQAGIEIGDLILTMDGVAITKSDDIIDVRDSHEVGDEVEVVVIREGKEITLNLVIGDSGDYEGAEYVGEDGK
jgi:serine protease Do